METIHPSFFYRLATVLTDWVFSIFRAQIDQIIFIFFVVTHLFRLFERFFRAMMNLVNTAALWHFRQGLEGRSCSIINTCLKSSKVGMKNHWSDCFNYFHWLYWLEIKAGTVTLQLRVQGQRPHWFCGTDQHIQVQIMPGSMYAPVTSSDIIRFWFPV